MWAHTLNSFPFYVRAILCKEQEALQFQLIVFPLKEYVLPCWLPIEDAVGASPFTQGSSKSYTEIPHLHCPTGSIYSYWPLHDFWKSYALKGSTWIAACLQKAPRNSTDRQGKQWKLIEPHHAVLIFADHIHNFIEEYLVKTSDLVYYPFCPF